MVRMALALLHVLASTAAVAQPLCVAGALSSPQSLTCGAALPGSLEQADGALGPQLVTDIGPDGLDFGRRWPGDLGSVRVVTLRNLPTLSAVGRDITDLTILDMTVSGDGFVLARGFQGLLADGDSALIDIVFTGNRRGRTEGLLTISTDQFSDFGMAGETFSFGLFGTVVPEPGSWAMMIAGFGLTGLMLRRRRERRLLGRAPMSAAAMGASA